MDSKNADAISESIVTCRFIAIDIAQGTQIFNAKHRRGAILAVEATHQDGLGRDVSLHGLEHIGA